MTTQPSSPPPQTDDELRARFRDLMASAARVKMDRDEALDMIAIAAELGSRGYKLNTDETDWLRNEMFKNWKDEYPDDTAD